MKQQWIPSWTAAPMNVWAPDAPPSGFYNQTIREIARVTLGGSSIRIKLTNEFGSMPVRLDAVTVAMYESDGRINVATLQQLTFNGNPEAVIASGAPVISDTIDFAIPNLSHLAVSYHASGFVPIETYHLEAQQSAYISNPGNFVDTDRMPVSQTTSSHYLLSTVFVESSDKARSIVCIGDSITDGYGASLNADRRYPDILAERLCSDNGRVPTAVVNQGIGGNRLLHDVRGLKALQRFDRDALAHRSATHVLLLAGINDIIWPGTELASADTSVPAGAIVSSLNQLITRAQVNGLQVIVGTLLPFENAIPDKPDGGFYTPAKEDIRQEVNDWIKNQKVADAIVDFDAVMQDPMRPSQLRPEYDSGDHVHPNDAGYKAMAMAIDLQWFK